MKIKNMSKRAISVFLSLMMCVSLLQVPAFAAADPQYDEFGNLITTENAAPVESETPVVTEPVVPETPVVPEDDAVVDNNTPDEGNGNNANTPDEGNGDNTNTPDEGTGDNANTPDEGNGEDTNSPDEGNGDNANTPDEGNGEDTNSPDEGNGDNANTPDEGSGDDTNTPEEGNGDDTNTPDEGSGDDTNTPDEGSGDDTNTPDEGSGDDTNTPDEVNGDDTNSSDEANGDNTNTPSESADPEEDDSSDVIATDVQLFTLESTAGIVVTTIDQLKSAIADADDNSETEISLGDDIDFSESTGIMIDSSKNIALNLCGFNITASNLKTKDNTPDSIFNVKGTLTINGKGTIEGNTVDNVINVGKSGNLTINGGTLTAENSTRGIFSTGTITMNGGTITGIDSNAKNGGTEATWKNALGGGVRINGGTMTMNGGTISNNAADLGGGVFVNKDTTFTMNGGTIGGNSAVNGGGVYVNGGEFTMDKNSAISNNIVTGATGKVDDAGNHVNFSSGGGVYMNGGTFTMKNGTIENNTAKGSTGEDAEKYLEGNKGGGVFVKNHGSFHLEDGIIANNHAGEGGGVFVFDRYGYDNYNKNNLAKFKMYGGTVQGNIAHVGEGGGIYIQGEGLIQGGKILDNETHTKADLGGGGVYVEMDGALTLINAIITENLANGLGGGLAACLHGTTSMVTSDGAAIYKNQNLYQFTDREGWKNWGGASNAGGMIDGSDNTWDKNAYTWKNDEDFKNAAKDVFSAGGSAGSSQNGAVFANEMVGGGLENWSGIFVDKGKKSHEVNSAETPIIYSNNYLGLTADPTQESIDAANRVLNDGGVLIQGNKSLYTNGGGVATNGVLTIGSEVLEEVYGNTPSLDITKELASIANPDGEKGNCSLTGGDFAFSLYSDKNCTTDSKVVTVTNDEHGKATLNIPSSYLDTSNVDGELNDDGSTTYTFTFYAKEDGKAAGEDDGTITYDTTMYKITVEVVAKTGTFNTGSIENLEDLSKRNVTTFTSSVAGIERINADGNGEVVSGNNLSFVNGYTKPVERSVSTPLEFSLEKVFQAVGEFTGNVSGKFNFEVSTEDGKVLSNEEVTVDLGSSKSATFSLDPKVLVENGFVNNDGGNFVFYVREVNDGQSNVTYSSATYQVSVPVVVDTVMKTITQAVDGTITDANKGDKDSFLANVTSYSFNEDELEVTATDASAGESFDEDDNIFKFINTYKPDEPETPDIPLTPLVTYDPFDLTIQKIFEVVNGTAPTNATFTFDIAGDLTDSKTVTFGTANQGKNTATADLRVLANRFNEDGTLQDISFTVTEKNDGMENVTYSGYTYEVSLKCATKVVDGMTHYYYVPTITCSENGSAVDGVAADIANNILTFTNVFKPTTPPTDTDSENPGPDPEEPTTPPTTPDRPSRPTPPPTPEEPTIDIPDDDVPLAPAPEEPEVSIPDEDVPLAGEPPLVELPEPEVPLAPMPPETTTIPDPEVPLAGVPQTGDNAGGFYALMALAACGLVVLNLRKKENEI